MNYPEPIRTKDRKPLKSDAPRDLVMAFDGKEWCAAHYDSVGVEEYNMTYWLPMPPAPKYPWQVAWEKYAMNPTASTPNTDMAMVRFRDGYLAREKEEK